MEELDALMTVYRMARQSTNVRYIEEIEALDVFRRYIEANFPLRARTILWDVDRTARAAEGSGK